LQRLFYIPILLLTVACTNAQTVQDNVSLSDSSLLVIDQPDTHISEPWDGFSSLRIDTSEIVNSGYGSLGDVINVFPNAFYLNRGSIGQMALTSLFSAPPNEAQLQYDDLILTDPLTGLSDLNLIPVEQIAEVRLPTLAKQVFWGYQSLGQTLQIIPRDISNLPVRSRIAYRTGDYNYDDIDVMLGMRLSPKTDLNLGGLVKNFDGLTSHEEYNAQKIRGRLARKIGSDSNVRYSFLFNRFDLDVHLPYNIASTTIPVRPHQKDLRYDHAITFEKKSPNRLKIAFQHTRLYREYYDYRAEIEELYEPDVLRLSAEYSRPIRSFQFITGGQLYANFIRSKNVDNFATVQGLEWLGAAYKAKQNVEIELLLKSTQRSGFAPAVNPAATLRYNPTDRWRFQLITSQSTDYPGPMELCYPSPVLAKSWNQRPMKNSSATLLGEYSASKVSVFMSVSLGRIKDRLVTHQAQEGICFTNHPLETRIGISGAVRYQPADWLQFYFKGMYNTAQSSTDGYHLLNLPKGYITNYVDVSRRLFKGDLLTTLRLGVHYLGPRWSHSFWTGEYGGEHMKLQSILVPYARIIFLIDNVTIFFSMQNLLGTEYQLMYGYPMPGSEFRWGLNWNLVD